jgi:N-acetylglucosaminyl-diphospho-decaprenol L-rhamnosyltransferase
MPERSEAAVVAIVLNFRDPGRTQLCIASVLREGALGVVVWDNSEDGGTSAAMLRHDLDSRVELVVSQRNLGFGAGVNAALSHMQARWPGAAALLINNDAELRPGALRHMRACMDEDTVVVPGIDHAGQVVHMRYMHRWFGAQLDRPAPGAFEFPSGACLLLPPGLSKGPLFDDAFFMYGEDVELGWRLLQSPRWHARSTGSVLVDHEVAASSGPRTLFYETHVAASHWLLANRLARGRVDRVLLKVCRCAYLLSRATVRSMRLQSMLPWRGLWSGLRLARVQERAAGSGARVTKGLMP